MNTEAAHLLDKRYTIQAEIGRGEMGIVYRAYDALLQRQVALKVLAPHLSQDPESVARFRQEAIAAAKLQHPNIVKIHDVSETGGYHYIVMEYLQGTPLDKWLIGRGPLPLEQAAHIIRQLASALDEAHRHDLVHRDVKPANVMLAADGRATLMDFGLVRTVNPGRGPSTGGQGAGTPAYMAPEQILGLPLGPLTDIYALGVVLYQLVLGQLPFVRDMPLATAYAHLNDTPRPPQHLRPDLPEPVAAVLLKALAKKPEERFASAGQLAAAFETACKGQLPAGLQKTSSPAPRRSPTPAPAPKRASPPLRWLALVAALLVIVSVGLAWALTRQPPPGVTPFPVAGDEVLATPAKSTPGGGRVTPTPPSGASPTPLPPIVSPTPQATASAQPTNTLAPTHTPTAIAVKTAPPSPTVTPTAVLIPAAPTLLEPREGLELIGVTDFVWEWQGELAPNWAFEVRFWPAGSGSHRTAAEAAAQPAGPGRWQQRIDIFQTDAVRASGPGSYWYTVAVVQVNPYQPIGAEAPPRRVTVGGSPPSAPPNTPAPSARRMAEHQSGAKYQWNVRS